MITKTQKAKVISGVQTHDKDTGSPAVQAALLTKDIESLVEHLKAHPKDNHSRRGLLGRVAQRQKTLKYLSKKDPKVYSATIKKLGLKK
jgi:small subunit ribosomal protein S15